MSKRHRWDRTPPTISDTHRYKYAARRYADWRGVRPEKASKFEYLSQFNRNLRLDPLKFERAKEPDNIFERYDIGNAYLPAHKHEKEIIDTIEANKVSIFSGATGSGKTTQLPQMALKAGYDLVVILQPRRINADTNGDRVEAEIRDKMGDDYPEDLVGVAHSERMTVKPGSKLQFMTADTFSNRLPQITEEWGDKKVLLMGDETHENGIPTEFACALGLQAVEAQPDWRMVYASATPDDTLKNNAALTGVNGKEVPEIHIEGQPQNIDYSEDSTNDVVESYLANSLNSKKSLIFVDGIPAADKARRKLLNKMSANDAKHTKIFMLSSRTTKREKDALVNMSLNPKDRAVIISTAAGQSGITIPGNDLVVLSGITRSPEIDDEKADGLPVRLCTQAELIQQGGRTGRDVSGRVILASPIRDPKAKGVAEEVRRFTTFNERAVDMPPEVYHTSLSRNALKIAALGSSFEKTNSYMKNRLSPISIAEANDVLFNLGAIDENDVITQTGARMDRYSLRPELSRAMIEFESNTERNVQIQALAIAAAVENGSLADHYAGTAWKNSLRATSTDDYTAQLDLMIASRPYYHGRYVEESQLRFLGIDPSAAYRANRQFDKMARVMGIDDVRDIEIEPTTLDQEAEIKDKFLIGMPELIFEYSSTRRRTSYYESMAGFQAPLERTISERSIMYRAGGRALKYLVGFPRWHVDRHGLKQNTIELVYSVKKEQIKRVLGHLALRVRAPEIRGSSLVSVGATMLGNLEIGGDETAPISAKTFHEQEMLARAALGIGTPAVNLLREFGLPDDEIFDALVEQAVGTSSAYEVDSRLWGLVGDRQPSVAYDKN